MSDRCRWYVQLSSTTVHVELGRCKVGRRNCRVLGTVSRKWKFSRRSFYTGLCGHAEEVIAYCRQPFPPDGTPAAPQHPTVLIPLAACWHPKLRPISQKPASGPTPCALCSAPKTIRKESIFKRPDHGNILQLFKTQYFFFLSHFKRMS